MADVLHVEEGSGLDPKAASLCQVVNVGTSVISFANYDCVEKVLTKGQLVERNHWLQIGMS